MEKRKEIQGWKVLGQGLPSAKANEKFKFSICKQTQLSPRRTDSQFSMFVNKLREEKAPSRPSSGEVLGLSSGKWNLRFWKQFLYLKLVQIDQCKNFRVVGVHTAQKDFESGKP